MSVWRTTAASDRYLLSYTADMLISAVPNNPLFPRGMSLANRLRCVATFILSAMLYGHIGIHTLIQTVLRGYTVGLPPNVLRPEVVLSSEVHIRTAPNTEEDVGSVEATHCHSPAGVGWNAVIYVQLQAGSINIFSTL